MDRYEYLQESIGQCGCLDLAPGAARALHLTPWRWMTDIPSPEHSPHRRVRMPIPEHPNLRPSKLRHRQRLQRFVRVEPDVALHAVRVTVWGRWFLLLVGVCHLAYPDGFDYPHDAEHAALLVPPAVLNGLVHHRLLTNRSVTWGWMLALSALDFAFATSHLLIHQGGFDNYVFLAYYPALGAFAVIFAAFSLILAWTTVVAVLYALMCVLVGPGLDLAAGDGRELAARLITMYLMAVAISLIVRFERQRRQAALEGERRMRQERIDLSQSIHDTVAQTAYMIGLGIDGAIRLAGDTNPRMTERLAATQELSKSAMWELRRPIDMGRLFEGQQFGSVLRSHTATFAAITSVPTEMAQSGVERPLAAEAQAGLLTVAHNALANAFLHAQAGRVEVRLDFGADAVRLSVCDDGVGLPSDYAERGRGFDGMKKHAERLGGRLIVETGGPDGGTTVTCVTPYETVRTGGCHGND